MAKKSLISQKMLDKWLEDIDEKQMNENKYIDKDEVRKIISQLKTNSEYGLDDFSDIMKMTILILNLERNSYEEMQQELMDNSKD